MVNIKSFLGQCARVWRLLKRPNSTEYKTTSKVAAIGLGVIGLIGFVISVIMNFLNF